MAGIAIVISACDPAGQNIKSNLLELKEWHFLGSRETGDIWERENYILIEIQEYHVYADGIDRKIEREGFSPELLIFASMHKARDPKPLITAHFTGNIGEAMHGGGAREIAIPAPFALKAILLLLKKMAFGSEFAVTMEGTHHGPTDLRIPSLYVEIGSSEAEWNDQRIGKIIASAITTFSPQRKPVGVSFGGSHYAPRQSQLLFETEVAFAHVIPEYALKDLDFVMLKKIFEKSKPDFAYLDQTMSKERRKWLVENIQKLGYRILSESDIRHLFQSFKELKS
ncbi:MAG: D-aminoacyl-tRNA deacylase [Halobacteria archaeon]